MTASQRKTVDFVRECLREFAESADGTALIAKTLSSGSYHAALKKMPVAVLRLYAHKALTNATPNLAAKKQWLASIGCVAPGATLYQRDMTKGTCRKILEKLFAIDAAYVAVRATGDGAVEFGTVAAAVAANSGTSTAGDDMATVPGPAERMCTGEPAEKRARLVGALGTGAAAAAGTGAAWAPVLPLGDTEPASVEPLNIDQLRLASQPLNSKAVEEVLVTASPPTHDNTGNWDAIISDIIPLFDGDEAAAELFDTDCDNLLDLLLYPGVLLFKAPSPAQA